MAAHANSAAYDLSRFEAPARPRLEVVKAPKAEPFSITRAWGVAPIKIILMVAFLVGVISVMLASQIALVEIGEEINAAQKELEILESEQIRLGMKLEESLSLQKVEEIAKQLGLAKMESYQVERVYLSDSAGVVVAKEAPGLWEQVSEFFRNIRHTLFGGSIQ